MAFLHLFRNVVRPFGVVCTTMAVTYSCASLTVLGQEPSRMLLSVDQLNSVLEVDNLRVLDVRSANAYQEGHIPGALRVDIDSWRSLATAEGGLKDSEAWAERVGALGIDQDTRVVVYGDSVSNTARVWWLLKYLGVVDVAILDGGWQAWSDSNGAQESRTPNVSITSFTPEFQQDRLEEIDGLKELIRLGTAQIIDTRSHEEFTGQVARGPRGGHIPDATHLEWVELLEPDGRFKSPTKLKQLFQERGISPTDTAVCY